MVSIFFGINNENKTRFLIYSRFLVTINLLFLTVKSNKVYNNSLLSSTSLYILLKLLNLMYTFISFSR